METHGFAEKNDIHRTVLHAIPVFHINLLISGAYSNPKSLPTVEKPGNGKKNIIYYPGNHERDILF